MADEVRDEVRYLVRISGKDLDGTKPTKQVLASLRGIGISLANVITKKLHLDPNAKLGSLSDAQVKQIEAFLADPLKQGLPLWMVNHRRDTQTNANIHLIGADLELTEKKDIEFMISMRCRKGLRHALGLKVRGQSTKSRGRKGRTMGVQRRKEAKAGMV